MGRFNWAWKTLRTLSVIMCAVWMPNATWAFTSTEAGTNIVFINDNNCYIVQELHIGFTIAKVGVMFTDDSTYYQAGGARWNGYDTISEDPVITAAVLERCLGAPANTISELKQTGSQAGVGFSNQIYMGFSFILSTGSDAAFLPDGYHHFYVGTESATSAAPTALVATPGDDQVIVAFTAPTSNGGATITDYEYQLDGGAWTSSGKTSSPVVITGLTNGTSYSIKLRAVNSAGDGTESDAVTSTPAATSNAPTALVATPGDGKITVAFTAPSNDGGATITNYEYSTDGGTSYTAFRPTMTSSPVAITGLINGTSYSIKLRAVNSAGNGAESAAVSVLLGSPASAFEEAEEEIKAIITQDATRSLTSTLSSNQRMTRGARSRFIESRGQGDGDGAGLATRNNVPFDVDGTFDLAGARVSSKGTFFGQTGNVEGTERRLVFGEFDVQRDGDTGSTTATLTGRVAWEQMISDDTMLGYFVGGELADSNISGAFEGKQTRVAATAGGYAVRALSETLFADGFISIGAGRNNLEMADDVLALTSDYTTRTATVGGALTGVYAYERYELRPEMAFSYGKTWIGDVGFTGVAYGLTDNTLSVDAGTVSTASLTLRPEIVWALDAETVAGSNAQLSFAPRFICERTTTATTTQNCGAGAEIGLSSNSEDGLSSANIRFVMDRVGNSNRSNVVFNVEQRF